jgi:mannose-6-phosphate isomerase-like protein (cupin superfamily)
MPKAIPSQPAFPNWSEVTNYGVNTLKPGDAVELHFHDCNEFWIIIEGKGIATSEGITYELNPGDMLLTKAGDEHSLEVTEAMIAVYFYGVMPPGGRTGHLHRGVDPDFDAYKAKVKKGD